MGIRNRELSMGHARAIVSIEDAKSQLEIYSIVLNKELSVRETEELVRTYLNENKPPKKKTVSKSTLNEYKGLQEHLSKFFDTKISFKRVSNGKGQIVIPFKSDDDLERIIGIFDKMKK